MNTNRKNYLINHKIQEILQDAINSCLKEMPEDPFVYISRYLVNKAAPTDNNISILEENLKKILETYDKKFNELENEILSGKNHQDLLFSAFNEVQLRFEDIMSTNSTVYEKIQELLDRQTLGPDEHLKKLEEVDEKFTTRLDALESKIMHLESSWADLKNIKEEIPENNKLIEIDKEINNDDNTDDKATTTITTEINNDEEKCFYISINENIDKKYLERIAKKKSDIPELIDTDEKGVFKILDTKWVKNNFDFLLEKCHKILLKNINTFEVEKDINISNSITLESSNETNLIFSNSSNIIIANNSKVEMKNFNIINLDLNNEKSLFILDKYSTLYLNQSFIERNKLKRSVFYVNSYATLELENCTFDQNILKLTDDDVSLSAKEEDIMNDMNLATEAICIIASHKSNIIIKSSEFMNHTDENDDDHPFSTITTLIKTNGDMGIFASRFENNTAGNCQNPATIVSNGSESIIIEETEFERSSQLNLRDINDIIIKNSSFIENNSREENGGCLYVNCEKISIENTMFKRNSSANSAGAIYFLNNIEDAILMNCFFEENSSGPGKSGGAVYFNNSGAKLVDCMFRQNASGRNGGAVLNFKSGLSCENCTFEDNFAAFTGCDIYSCHGTYTDAKSNVFK